MNERRFRAIFERRNERVVPTKLRRFIANIGPTLDGMRPLDPQEMHEQKAGGPIEALTTVRAG